MYSPRGNGAGATTPILHVHACGAGGRSIVKCRQELVEVVVVVVLVVVVVVAAAGAIVAHHCCEVHRSLGYRCPRTVEEH